MSFFTPNGTTDFARHSDETRIRTFVRKNLCIHPGHGAADVGTPVLRSTVEAVTSVRQCLCAQERNSRLFGGTLLALASDATCFG